MISDRQNGMWRWKCHNRGLKLQHEWGASLMCLEFYCNVVPLWSNLSLNLQEASYLGVCVINVLEILLQRRDFVIKFVTLNLQEATREWWCMQLLHRQQVYGGHGGRSRHILWHTGSCPLWGEPEECRAPSFRLHALPPYHCGRAPGPAHHCGHIRWVLTRRPNLCANYLCLPLQKCTLNSVLSTSIMSHTL